MVWNNKVWTREEMNASLMFFIALTVEITRGYISCILVNFFGDKIV